MALPNKVLSEQAIKSLIYSSSKENNVDFLKTGSRPTNTIGNSNKSQQKSSQSGIKKTRSNSFMAADHLNNNLNSTLKLTMSPTKQKFKNADSNLIDKVNSPKKLKTEKKPLGELENLAIKQKTSSANKSFAKDPMKEFLKSRDSLTTKSVQGKSSLNSKKDKNLNFTTASKKVLKDGVKDGSLSNEPSIGWNHSISYGIADFETPSNKNKEKKLVKNKQQASAAAVVIQCEIDLRADKGIKQSVKEDGKKKATQKPTEILVENCSLKKVSPKNAGDTGVKSPVVISSTFESMKQLQKSAKKEKPSKNETATKLKGKENQTSEPQSPAIAMNRSPKKNPELKSPVLAGKKSPTKTINKTTINKTKEKSYAKQKEAKMQLSLSRIPIDSLTDISTITSSSLIKELLPKTVKSPTKTITKPKLAAPQSPKDRESKSFYSPTTEFSIQSQAESNLSIQPSKHSDFSFKMTYFRPIEDEKLDEYIRDINESLYSKKRYDRTLSIASDKSFCLEKSNQETFSIPMPTSQALASERREVVTTKERNGKVNQEKSQPRLSQKLGMAKKASCEKIRNQNDLALKNNSVQEISGYFQPKENSEKVGKRGLEERSINASQTESSFMKGKKVQMSMEKIKARDEGKEEYRSRNTFSKLDRILQEMKDNRSSMMNDENMIPAPEGDADDGLFNHESRAGSTSSSTNCSLNKSFANTLRKLAINQSES